MPPKKSSKRKAPKRKQDKAEEEVKDDSKAEENGAQENGAEDAHTDKKAKTDSSTDSKPSSNKLVKWLLSDEAFSLANPDIPSGKGEIDAGPGETIKPPPTDSAGKQSSSSSGQDGETLSYPGSRLTPFQNLVCSVLLSKPISHRLGLRTIKTLLNPPFGLRSASDLDEAGYEGRRKVMWEARTQHKEKTAMQLGDLVAGVRALADGEESGPAVDDLTALRDKAKSSRKSSSPSDSADAIRSLLVDNIKGVGPTGTGIFLRRVQVDWEEVFPFADEKVLGAAVKLDLIKDGEGAEELSKVIGGSREEFVRVLDVLLGLELEKKLDEAKSKVK